MPVDENIVKPEIVAFSVSIGCMIIVTVGGYFLLWTGSEGSPAIWKATICMALATVCLGGLLGYSLW